IISVMVPFAFLVTGTRSALVLGVGFAGFLVWRLARGKILRTLSGGALAMVISLPILGWLASELLSSSVFLSRRIAALQAAITYGSLGDESLAIRQYSTAVVQSAIEGRWLFGLGLSTPDPLTAFDTPLASVLRIGVAGNFFLLVYFIVAVRWAMKTAPRNAAGDSVRAVIGGWFLVVLAYGVLLNPPTDDRLFAFALAIALALAVNARESSDHRGFSVDSAVVVAERAAKHYSKGPAPVTLVPEDGTSGNAPTAVRR
ncbi:MAG: hypothetical protein WCN98_13420, partial [Verrucomicrobiaceae bacterium]